MKEFLLTCQACFPIGFAPVAALFALHFDDVAAESLRDEQRVNRTVGKRLFDHHFTVSRFGVGSNQFLEEPIHDLPLGVKLNLAHELPGVLYQFTNTRLVGITDVEGGLGDFFGDFMVEIFVLDHEIFGGARSADDDGLDVLKVRQPIGGCVLCGPLEKVVSSFFDEPFKTLSGLTTLPVLAHDVGDKVFLHVNSLARGDAIGCFCSVDDEQAVRFFVDQHFFELCQFKPRIAAVPERNQRLGWVLNDDVDHAAFVVANDDRANKIAKPCSPGVL